jgi:hypothetical protein
MKQEPTATEVEILRIGNDHSQPVQFHLEPWGELLSISPDTTFEVVAEGPPGDYLEVRFREGHITVYGWSGSVVSVFQEGTLLRECKIPVPATPRRQPAP